MYSVIVFVRGTRVVRFTKREISAWVSFGINRTHPYLHDSIEQTLRKCFKGKFPPVETFECIHK
jgi:hypothetical protein